MARARPAADETRYRSLPAPGWSADAVADLVLADLRAHPDLRASLLAPGRIGVARTHRPRWALVAGVATIWLGGLGLLFLMVRRTDAGEVAIHDGPRGCTVLIPPILAGAPAERIVAALRGDADPPATGLADAAAEPAEVAAASDPIAPSGTDDDLEGRTVARRAAAPETGAPTGAAAGQVAVAALRFEGATVALAPGDTVVLGRDPSPTGAARAEVVPGDATTVSKSHLLVAFDGTEVTVEDLGSTNGTVVLAADGERPLVAGATTRVADGDRLRVGTVPFSVTVGRGGSDGADQ